MTCIQANEKALSLELIFGLKKVRKTYFKSILEAHMVEHIFIFMIQNNIFSL